MAQTYCTVDQAAEILGVSPDEVRAMRERGELYGYRDGANWKFKADDLRRVAEERAQGGTAETDDEGDLLLSEHTLGEAGPSTSGTVIGMERAHGDPGSDIALANPSDSDLRLTSKAAKEAEAAASYDDLDLTLDEDLTLADSNPSMAKGASKSSPAKSGPAGKKADDSGIRAAATSDSSLDLADDDVDAVLGGSGSGSDVTIGGDSGISLVDPSDSGISLEDPLALGGEESLELGEDDILTTGESSSSDAKTQLRSDDDFLLTPMPDEGGDEDSESGSQVIALDTEGSDDAGMMAGGPATASMVAMLDEDVAPGAGPALGMGVPAAGMPAAAMGMGADQIPYPVAAAPGEAVLPEAPWGTASLVGLVLCTLFLAVSGMMMYDLLNNMWHWHQAGPLSSPIMDGILSLIEKR